MPSSSVPPPSHVIRVSPAAWALALSSVSGIQPGHTDELDGPVREAAWAELNRLGVAAGTELTPRWCEPLREVLSPVTLLRLSAAYNGVGANTDFTITGNRGVCVHRRSTIETDDDGGIRTTGHEPSLEVALFDTEHIWGAVSRVLPPLAELRADAVLARTDAGDNVVHMPLTPSEAAAVVPEEAILSAAMTTRSGESRQVWAGRWSVSQGTLYSVRTTDGALLLTPQRAGHVAREIVFALAGSYEFLAGAAASA
ncbi:hypothetical protein [uncultured Arthrobacter sp.]|uniref:hypothetical protein n=1 Tax=uncultured Arthrobacter sp. TaxID=114050 RepID=UPI00262DC337|nr:hypothetical protein [uncultured Arthrobacter sp.]